MKFFNKKIVIIALSVFVLAGTVGVASAQTTTSTASTTLDALLRQLRTQQDQVKQTLALIGDLREGMTSEEVKALQELLAADPSVYPEGIISGFFGPLTKNAVKRFQAKNGIDQLGIVGPKTRQKLNELAGDSDFQCKAWGRLIAPGQRKKVGMREIDLSHCNKVPEGIFKKLTGDWWKGGNNGTSTTATSTTASSTDTAKPKLSRISVIEITDEEATVKWVTNELAKSEVRYGVEENVLTSTTTETEMSSTLVKRHAIELEDLEENTKYFYVVISTDKAGNVATSSVRDFTTTEDDEDDSDDDEDEDDE